MKSLNIVLAAAVLAVSVPTVMTSSASAYQCKTSYTQVKVHRPTKMAARIQVRKSWSIKVKGNLGQAWTVWQIANKKKIRCKKAGQRYICKARAKPCLYVVQ